MAKIAKRFMLPAAIALSVILCTSCGDDESAATTIIEPQRKTIQTTKQSAPKWKYEELKAMALTLAGECYDDEPEDKRSVCEVILNRVSSEGFPNTVVGVVEEPNQFDGYWEQSRPISSDDYAVAKKALTDWYDNGCEPLSEYYFFEAGDGHTNEFREEF